MLSLRKPSADSLSRFLDAQEDLPFSYDEVGATRATPPAGYDVDHTRICLGEGEQVYKSAKAALERWEQFQLGWVEALPRDTPLAAGKVVVVLGWAVGFWWRNACRVVYTIDEPGDTAKFGFAYGTLPGHVESGEERFQIEWHHSDNRVWYDILAISKPRKFLAKLGYPVVRRLQKRFARESAASMLRAVGSSSR